ncbi:MAG: histidine kinase dimerization/phospho-acceptor domain-containing protein, partial [Actinomycetota bacterium]
MTDVETDLRTLRNTSSTVALAMVFLSGAIGWISTVGLMRPITRARDAAIEMQKGDLTTRLPEAGTGEVAELARSFNSMAETLQATLASLTEAEAGQRRFVADVSHELRTPLTALSAAVDVMEQNIGDMPPPAARAAQLIIGESRRLRTLVEDLMEISRFDSGKLNMDKRMIDVGDAVRSMLTARGWMG